MISNIKGLSRRLQFVRDCKVVFDSPQGMRVLSYLMREGCVTTPVSHPDRDQSLRNEGMQHLVLSILRASKQTETELEEQLIAEYED